MHQGKVTKMPSDNTNPSNTLQALDHPVTITRFPSLGAYSKKAMRMSMRELAGWIERQKAASKDKLPWIKLASFGNDKALSPSGDSFRTNANVKEVMGLEGDYDGERITPEEARAKLKKARIAGAVYTTGRHTPEKPRWRVLCPFSGPLPPEAREDLMARLNGVFGGVLDPASFTLSQAYYAGSVDGGEPVKTYLVEGEFIDKVEGLTPIYKHGGNTKPDPIAAAPAEDQSDIPQAVDQARAMLTVAKAKIAKAQERTPIIFEQAFWMGGFVACNTLTEEEVLDALSEAAEEVGHQATYGDDVTERTIRNGLAYGEQFPLPWFDPVSLLDECWTPEELEAIAKEALDAETQAAIEELVGVPAKALAKVEWGTPMMRGDKPVINLYNTTVYLGRNLDSILPGLAHNRMTGRDEWRDGQITDAVVSIARMALEKRGLETVGKDLVADAAQAVARKLAYHPIRDYLDGLRWDGVPRLDSWLVRHAGADDTPYTRAVGRKFLLAMVARVMKPGCKHDHTLVLSGEQGQDKSKACSIIAGAEHFSDTLPSISGDKTDAIRHLQGKWLVELAEMAPSRKSDAEDLKAFLSGAVDRVRMPYAKFDEAFPRQCVFVGTTNDDQFLRDATGGRRFWPVAVRQVIDTESLAAERDQLFAEAMDAFKEGEPWWLDREFEAEHAAPVQAAAYVADSWGDDVALWLDNPHDELEDQSGVKMEVTVSQVLSDALGINSGRHSMADQKRAGDVMRQLGWTKHHTMRGKVWRRLMA